MSEFLYNQEITADMLNNIAVDLGATTFSEFSNDTEYAVTKLNNITKNLVGKGILTSENKCKCTLTNGVLTISTGIIIFENGSKIRITDPLTFTISTTEKIYVYAVNNTTSNTASIEFKNAELTTGGFVALCEIENNVLTDKRTVAMLKVPLPATKRKEITLNANINYQPKYGAAGTFDVDIGHDDYDFIITAPSSTAENNNYQSRACYDLKKGTGFIVYHDDDWFFCNQTNLIWQYSDNEWLSVNSLKNGILTLNYFLERNSGYQYNEGYINQNFEYVTLILI